MLIHIPTDADLNKIFFTADHHFGHENIIKYTNRPFDSVAEMDQALIDNWNKIVGPGDTVYHLGDFTLGDWSMACNYLQQLNGRIKFLCISWHHDKRWLPENNRVVVMAAYHIIEWLSPMVVLEVPQLGKDGHPLAITLCHYPVAVWDRKHYGAWHLHGHSHGNYQYPADDFAIDIGVDCMNFYPVSLGNVLGLMYERGYV